MSLILLRFRKSSLQYLSDRQGPAVAEAAAEEAVAAAAAVEDKTI